MGYVNVDLLVTDSSPQKNPLLGVLVRVYSQDGKLLYTQASSDQAGTITLLLPDTTTYQARFYRFGVAFTNPIFFYASPDPAVANVFYIQGTPVTPPVPMDARLCAAYGFFRNADGSPKSSLLLRFMAKFKPLLLEGSGVLPEPMDVRTDSQGYVQINLIRNGQYDVTAAGLEDMQRLISVPDLPNINLPDLLFPVVSAVTLDPEPPIIVPLNGQMQLTPSVFLSDGNPDPQGSSNDLIWSSDNPAILGVTIAGGILTLAGLGVGTANLVAVRSDQTIVRIPDTPVAGLPLQVSVQ